jgi:Tol biopolymer transport system component
MSAVGERGVQLWVRSLDSLQWQVLAGTDDAGYPFWSPDSRYIGFFTADKLKKIAVGGGPAQTICGASAGLGGTWNQDGVIVFGIVGTPLLRVPAAGGVPTKVTESVADQTIQARSEKRPGYSGTPEARYPYRDSQEYRFSMFPTFLPDGQRFLYATGQGVILGSLSMNPGSKLHLLLPSNSNSQYVPPSNLGDPGHVLFVREQTLIAQPVKPDSLELTGDSFPLVEQVAAPPSGNYYLFSASRNGIIAHMPGSANLRQHALLDRSGKQLAAIGAPVETPGWVAWSPDEKRMIWERRTGDLWITELEGGTESRFTFDGFNLTPQWSRDGARVAFRSIRGGTGQIYQKLANQAGQDELVVNSGSQQVPSDWTRGYIIVRQSSKDTAFDLIAIPMDGEKKPIPLLQTKSNEIEGVVSSDGRWLAYASDESGHFEVYVQPFLPGNSKASGGKWQISLGGGRDPHWRGDGRELFYIAADRKMMAVPVQASADSFSPGTPKSLFEARIFVGTLSRYAVSANGQRFLMALDPEASTTAPVHVIVNWLAGLKK